MYTPLRLPSSAPPSGVAHVVRHALDPRLEDVHAMLRLPLPAEGLKAGCNFTIADSLFGIIEGVSAALWPRYGREPHVVFEQCVTRHYRSRDEGVAGGFSDAEIAKMLYAGFRSPMQHTLGLALKPPDRQGIRERDASAMPMVVFRDKESLTEEQIEEMERGGWPAFLHRPTLERVDGILHLTVEAFYVGTRRLIASVLADQAQIEAADIAAPSFGGTLSSADGQIVHMRTSAPTLVDSGATAGPTTSTSTEWTAPDTSGQ